MQAFFFCLFSVSFWTFYIHLYIYGGLSHRGSLLYRTPCREKGGRDGHIVLFLYLTSNERLTNISAAF